MLMTEAACRDLRANRMKRLNEGGWHVRRVLRNGKLGAIIPHYATKQTEYTQAAAESEAARLCELNGEDRFRAVKGLS